MPEELHPGVYLEEVAYRSKAIPGVPTLVFLAGVLLGVAASVAVERARRRRSKGRASTRKVA